MSRLHSLGQIADNKNRKRKEFMMKRKEKRRIRVENKVNEVINAYREGSSETDPQGQYTGNTADTPTFGGKVYINASSLNLEKPVQDADDL